MATGDRFAPSRPRQQPDRPAHGDRPSYGGGSGGNRPPFSPRPPFAGQGPRPAAPPGPASPALPTADTSSTVRLRDGNREVQVTGSPAFIRQTLGDLGPLFAGLTGTPVPTPAAISIPAAEPRNGVPGERHSTPANTVPEPTPAAPSAGAGAGAATLEEQVFAVLRRNRRPLRVADIRAELDGDVTGQQVRRILERSDRVISNDGKPAGYRLR